MIDSLEVTIIEPAVSYNKKIEQTPTVIVGTPGIQGPPGPPVELSLNPYNALQFDQEGKLFCPAVQSGLTDW